MIERIDVAKGLTLMAAALRFEVDEPSMRAFSALLRDETTSEEWIAFCTHACRAGLWQRAMPTLPELLQAMREWRGEESIDSEALRAYERVLGCNTYVPDAGGVWSYRQVAAECGKAAAEAFAAAGGHGSFSVTYKADERRTRFLAAYRSARMASPEGKLLPAGTSRPALGEGRERSGGWQRAGTLRLVGGDRG